MENSYYFEIDSSYKDVTVVTKKCRQHLILYYVNESWVLEFESCLTEALNNVIDHAYKGFDKGHIGIKLSIDPEYTVVEITDIGLKNINFNADAPVNIPDPSSLPEGGWGILIIQQYSSSIDYDYIDGVNILKIKKQFTYG